MNPTLLHSATSFLTAMLAVWAVLTGLSRALRLPTYNLRWRFAFGAFALGLAAMPVGQHTFARVITGCGFVPSIPFLVLLADGVIRDLRGTGWLGASECQAGWTWGALAGLALYPSALGLGRFDVYGLGWGFTPLGVGIGAVTVGLLWRGHALGIVLVVAAVAWQAGLLESTNYWDYLVDPVYFLASLVALAVGFVRSQWGALPQSR